MAKPTDIYDELTPSGVMVAPQAVIDEGARIRAAIAAGTYGNQPIQAQAPGGVVIAQAPTPLIEGSFGASGLDWAQADWNKTPGQLRQDLKLDDLRTIAAQRRLELENAPVEMELKNRLVEAQTNAAGAHNRFLQYKDARALEATHGFLNDLMAEDAPGPGDPGHRAHIVASLNRNKGFASTPGGQKILAKLAEGGDTAKSVADLAAQVPPGYTMSGIRIGPKGPSVAIKPAGTNVAKELSTNYGLKPGDLGNPGAIKIGSIDRSGSFTGDDRGQFVRITKGDGNSATMPVAEFERLGGKFSPETATARGATTTAPSATPATKHLGTYNPATGEFDK